jgi:predicted HTH transcriptional regulator
VLIESELALDSSTGIFCASQIEQISSVVTVRLAIVKNQGCLQVFSPTTPEIIDQIHELILEDRQISAKSITDQLDISRERVGSIIHEDLDNHVACFLPGRAKDLSVPL